LMKSFNINCAENFSLRETLGVEVKIQKWTI